MANGSDRSGDTPPNVQGVIACIPDWDPARGLHQGQQPIERLHQQAEDKTASDPRQDITSSIAMREPSRQVIGVASAFEPWRSLERLWLTRTSDAFWHHLLMGLASKSLICLGLMGLTFATASCGKGTEGKMGFFEWYMRGFRKGKVEQSARDAENAKDAERNARFWAWAKSPEGKKSIAGRTKITLEAKAGYPDTIYEMSPGSAFKISSRSAGITLSGSTVAMASPWRGFAGQMEAIGYGSRGWRPRRWAISAITSIMMTTLPRLCSNPIPVPDGQAAL